MNDDRGAGIPASDLPSPSAEGRRGALAAGASAGPVVESCPSSGVSVTRELIDNIPYAIMIVCGVVLFALGPGSAAWRWTSAIGYALYGVGGAFWIMVFVCPYCHFYDTRLCPCGYGRIAAKLRPRAGAEGFARQFRRHIPVIVPLWFLPLIAGAVALALGFAWSTLTLMIVFAVNSFVVLPLVSRQYGCKTCPQKEGCPWMGGCKGG